MQRYRDEGEPGAADPNADNGASASGLCLAWFFAATRRLFGSLLQVGYFLFYYTILCLLFLPAILQFIRIFPDKKYFYVRPHHLHYFLAV